jgi:alpha-1,2-mannosyltransferase
MPDIDGGPRGRLFGYALVLLIAEVVATLWFVAGTHGWIVPLASPTSTDFASFYAAGKLAAAGTAPLAYDRVAHQAAEWAATAPGIEYQFFFYPPVFLLLAAPLSVLPYLPAFAVFEVATLLFYLAALRPILGVAGWRWLVPALGFPAVFWTLGLGQNAFLSAGLFAVGTRLLDRRPGFAGLALGCLIYKPHLGLLIPLALLAGRHWRAITGAAAGAGGLILLSGLVFGWEAWAAFLAEFTGAHGTYENGRIELAGMITVFAAARLLGLPTAVGYAAQALAGVAAAVPVALLFWRRAALPPRAAALLAATLLAVPVLLLYDLTLLAVAGAWLLAPAHERGRRPGEVPTLIAGYVTPLICRPIGLGLHLGVAPLAAAALLVAAVRRGCGRSAAT